MSNRANTLLFVAVINTALFVLLVSFFIGQQHAALEEQQQLQRTAIDGLFKSLEQGMRERYQSRMRSFSRSKPAIITAFQEQNRQQLLALSRPYFSIFSKENPFVRAMTYVLPDNKVLLRIHDPADYGDELNRSNPMLAATNLHQQPRTGYTLCRHGLMFHVSQPLFDGDTYLGFICIGIDIDFLLDRLRNLLDSHIELIFPLKLLRDKPPSAEPVLQVGGYAFVSHRDSFVSKLPPDADLSRTSQQVDMEKRTYSLYSGIVISDPGGRELARLLIGDDISEGVHGFRWFLALTILFALLVQGVSMLAIYLGISSQNKLRDKLELARQELENIFNSVQDGVSILDLDFNIVKVNPWVERLYGPREALIGSKCYDVYQCRHEICSSCPAAKTLESGQVCSAIINYSPAAGEARYLLVTASPLYDEHGELIGIVEHVKDISQIKRTEEKLRQSRERYQSLFQGSPVPLWEEDFTELYNYLTRLKNNGVHDFRTYFDDNPAELHHCMGLVKILDVNQAAVELHQAESREALIAGLDAILTEESYAVFKEEVLAIAQGRQSFESEAKVKTLRGESRDISVRFALETDGHGSHRAMVVTTDITGQKKTELELQIYGQGLEELIASRTDELQAVNRELESFAYSVSHDLRVPLRAMGGFSSILLEEHREQLDEQGRDFLKRIHHGAREMGALIDGLLHLSRSTRGEIHRESVNLSLMAEGICARLAEEEPGRHVEWDIEPGLQALADYRLIQVVLENLLANSWKFTAGRQPARIGFFSLAEGSDDFPELRGRIFCIQDNGAGFNMRHADKLFVPFQRLHRRSEFSGTGIGLATVQRIIHRHGGEISARGEIGLGASFYFTLSGRDMSMTGSPLLFEEDNDDNPTFQVNNR